MVTAKHKSVDYAVGQKSHDGILASWEKNRQVALAQGDGTAEDNRPLARAEAKLALVTAQGDANVQFTQTVGEANRTFKMSDATAREAMRVAVGGHQETYTLAVAGAQADLDRDTADAEDLANSARSSEEVEAVADFLVAQAESGRAQLQFPSRCEDCLAAASAP